MAKTSTIEIYGTRVYKPGKQNHMSRLSSLSRPGRSKSNFLNLLYQNRSKLIILIFYIFY
jgi:hypothetical protein